MSKLLAFEALTRLSAGFLLFTLLLHLLIVSQTCPLSGFWVFAKQYPLPGVTFPLLPVWNYCPLRLIVWNLRWITGWAPIPGFPKPLWPLPAGLPPCSSLTFGLKNQSSFSPQMHTFYHLDLCLCRSLSLEPVYFHQFLQVSQLLLGSFP